MQIARERLGIHRQRFSLQRLNGRCRLLSAGTLLLLRHGPDPPSANIWLPPLYHCASSPASAPPALSPCHKPPATAVQLIWELSGMHCNSCFRLFVDICWGKIKQRPAYPRTDGVHSMFGRGFSESNTEKIVLHKFFDHTGYYRYGRSTRKSCALKVLESDLHGV